MKILIIGGTGTISSAITRQLSESGHEVWLLNRGNRRNEVPGNVRQVIADIDDTEAVLGAVGGEEFDAVCEFIGFVTEQVERDIRLFKGGRGSTSTSRQPRPITSPQRVTSSPRAPVWQTPTGSTRATK